MDKIKIGVIGLGGRGFSMLKHIILKMDNCEVVALCDVYEDRVASALQVINKNGGDARGYTDWREALNSASIDVVFVFSDWSTHTDISVYAMEKGINDSILSRGPGSYKIRNNNPQEI